MIVVPTAVWAHPLFDLAAWACGIATSVTLYRWRLRELACRVAMRVGPGYFVALCTGAVSCAWLSGSLNTLRDPAPVLSHSVAGALVGGIVGVEIYKALYRLHGSTGALFVGGFAVGVMVGRWGCLFTGLPDQTYGIATALPWGVDLGDGVARHPVQVYESLSMAAFLAVYILALYQRRSWALERSFYILCLWYGLQRFLWEWLKPYPKVLGPLNIFQLLSLGLMAYAVIYDRRNRSYDRSAPDRALHFPGSDNQPV